MPLHNRRLRAGSTQAGGDHYLLGLSRRTNKSLKVRFWREQTISDHARYGGFVPKHDIQKGSGPQTRPPGLPFFVTGVRLDTPAR
jgi:hypothetical protein